MNTNEAIGERVRYIREHEKGMSVAAFARLLNEKDHRIRDIESGKQKIPPEIIIKLRNILDVNPDWLLTGKGEIYSSKITIKKPSDFIPSQDGSKYKSNDKIEIPYYPETFAAAGAGAYNYEEAPKSITFTKTFLEDLLELTIFKGLHIINAIGDSMSPTIESGDKLFVLPFEVENCKVREGGIYVISCNFGVLVKRIYFNPFKKELILKSDNKEIPDITISGDELDGCQIIGRVVGSIKKF